MNPMLTRSTDVLLARVNQELERISEVQHRLARRKTLLQEQATRLRLGASPWEVQFTLEATLATDRDEDSVPDWAPEERTLPERERLGGVVF